MGSGGAPGHGCTRAFACAVCCFLNKTALSPRRRAHFASNWLLSNETSPIGDFRTGLPPGIWISFGALSWPAADVPACSRLRGVLFFEQNGFLDAVRISLSNWLLSNETSQIGDFRTGLPPGIWISFGAVSCRAVVGKWGCPGTRVYSGIHGRGSCRSVRGELHLCPSGAPLRHSILRHPPKYVRPAPWEGIRNWANEFVESDACT